MEAISSEHDQLAQIYLDSMALYLPERSQPSFYHDVFDGFHVIWQLRHYKKTPQVLQNAQTLLTKIQQDQQQNIPVMLSAMLADALAQKKEIQMAIEAYLFCAAYADKHRKVHLQRIAYFPLGELYARIGDYTASSSALLKAHAADQVFTERRNAGLMMQFKVKNETLEKEKLNQLLLSQLQLKEKTIQSYVILGVCLFLSCLFLILWLLLRQRVQREKDEMVLKSMLLERQVLNRQNEELLKQLSHVPSQPDFPSLQQILSPRLLTHDEEQEFRRQFAVLYPMFLIKLRKICPHLTKGEELLSMMIKLNLSSEEIAFALGNTKSSVNTSRFRFRKKLEMDKEASLEAFLHKL